jgi:hypothetical protein
VPTLILLGDSEHGVARYANQIADAIDNGGCPVSATGPAHAHFTDRMWGSSPEDAAEHFERVAAQQPTSVTLHDLPQHSDGTINLPRRIACYARVVAAAHGVVCNSAHEALLLAEFVDASITPTVIPLPVDVQAQPDSATPVDGSVALVGFFYPGKGHRDAVDAVTLLHPPLSDVVALGKASPGHERDLANLERHAETVGVRFSATGFLSDAELIARCRRAGVPLAAHQHVSASGSLGTWISAGRRPLVPNTRYSREMSELRPGTVTLYEPGELGAAIAYALENPRSTWWGSEASTGPSTQQVTEQYIQFWAGLL